MKKAIIFLLCLFVLVRGYTAYDIHQDKQRILRFVEMVEEVRQTQGGKLPTNETLYNSEIYKQKFPELVHTESCPCYQRIADDEYVVWVGTVSLGESFIYNSKTKKFN